MNVFPEPVVDVLKLLIFNKQTVTAHSVALSEEHPFRVDRFNDNARGDGV